MKNQSPSYTESDLESVIVTKEQIQKRVKELGKELTAHYRGQDVTLISILSGALIFTADLVRSCSFPTRLDSLRAESYGNATTAQSWPRITTPLKTDIAGHHILLVDDILDSGNTMKALLTHLASYNPASLKSCVLLDKPARHEKSLTVDFCGFTIPDEFVVGYGLDFAERYRDLQCIGVLKKDFRHSGVHA